jgi:HAE1 family hydrophobic/amphiphilic exporter-1
LSFAENVAALAARRPVAISVMAVAIALVGWLSWKQLPVDLLPDLQSPTIAVSIRAGDRPPTEMERLYGEQLEQRLFTVQGIREISQVARSGKLVATIIFEWDANLEIGLVEVQKALGPMGADPAVDEVVVRRFDPRQAPVLTFGLIAPTGKPDLAELRQLARRQVATNLEQLSGVAEVRVTGGREKELRIELDRYKLDAFNVSLAQVEQRLQAENQDFNAGTLEQDSKIFLVRGMSRFRRAEDVANVVVRYATAADGSQQAIRVSDVGNVKLADQEFDHLVRVNGIEGVGLAIYKEAAANTVEVSQVVRKAMTNVARDLPNVELIVVNDDASLVIDALSDLQVAAGVGIFLALVILALFLRSAGATLVVFAAVPVSILAALFLMGLGSQTLNIVTLAGLALGAGMLVDNAIVVVESIYRRLAEGDSPSTAAATGTGQVAGAITASTLTTCVVFLPVLFVQGMAARLIEGIAFTVIASLLASLVVAMMLIPALARWFMPDASDNPEAALPKYRQKLEALVRKLLARPGQTVAITLVIAGLAIFSLVKLGTELLPSADPRQFSLRVVGPSGQRVESTSRLIESIESLLNQANGENLEAVLSEIGRLPEDTRLIRTELTEENTAELTVRVGEKGFTGKQLADHLSPHLETMERTEFDWQVGSSALASALGSAGPSVVVEVSGQALPDIRRGTEMIQQRLAELPELWNVRSSFEGGPPELRIVLDRTMADGLGIDLNTLARVLEASLDGRDVTTLSTGDEDKPVRLRTENTTREDLERIVFRSNLGQKVTVGEIARFEEVEGAREIFRRDQRRTAIVTAEISESVKYPEAVAAVSKTLEEPLVPGLNAQLRGEEAERIKTFNELKLAGILALVLVLMVLAGSFESFIHPITVLSAIPIALIGVALVLGIVGEPVGVMAMMGFIVLAGVAVNDAVLLLATARQSMAQGIDRVEALVSAAGIRLRPILMTTLTTVLVLMPLIFGTGEGASLRAPMAITIISGIIASTAGSLLILPCVYLLLDRIRFRNT